MTTHNDLDDLAGVTFTRAPKNYASGSSTWMLEVRDGFYIHDWKLQLVKFLLDYGVGTFLYEHAVNAERTMFIIMVYPGDLHKVSQGIRCILEENTP